MPGKSMNVFSVDLMDSLERLLDEVESRADVRGVVVTSGKSAFLAGADLDMVRMYTEHAQRDSFESLHKMCGRLGHLFRRLETNGKPYVAAIDGLALGGGLELALACHHRIATDDDGTRLGLPEIKLGLLPGAGGTQRLPRLIGTQAALALLLGGDPVSAQRALEMGIVDEVVAKRVLLIRARQRADLLAKAEARAPWDRSQYDLPVNAFDLRSSDVIDAIAAVVGVSKEQLVHYPAYRAIMNCVISGWGMPMDAACRWEMDCFVRLIQDNVAGNMVRSLFLDRQRAAKLLPRGTRSREMQVAIEGPAAGAARDLIAGTRVTVVARERLPQDGLVFLTGPPPSGPAVDARNIAWLRDARSDDGTFGATIGIWVSDVMPHGRAVEICVHEGELREADNVFEFVLGLWASPLVTRGCSFFQSLHGAQTAGAELALEDQLLVVALAAARAWCRGGVLDTGIADSAAVIAGFHPAYTGGPFAYLRQCGFANVEARVERGDPQRRELFALPPGFNELFAKPARASDADRP
jgi:3-hydroxyacyl-CoA dehydrogenase/enoyl-CoA hydratase/3-hydroxybutyryl-CoA epimerase